MAEENEDVLVLTDGEGNLYALPRRVVERARVPDELKGVFPARPWSRAAVAERRQRAGSVRFRGVSMGVLRQGRPWPVGWFRVPPAQSRQTSLGPSPTP
jgi:hypothetical protein